MNCVQLARAGLFLAHGGVDPIDRHCSVDPQVARRINAIMMTCSHDDSSGDFVLLVGLLRKSGVGGAILAIAPRRASIAVWSPRLDASGNAPIGARTLESLARNTGWSVL